MDQLAGRIYDVSMAIVSDGLVFPGDPPIEISPHLAIAAGDPANVSRLALGSHTGTHVDAPSHFFSAGGAVDTIPLERLVGPAVVLHFPEDVAEVGATQLSGQRLRGARRVLLRTRNSARLSRSGFSPDYVALAPDGARYLLEQGVELVGIDCLSIERYGTVDHPVHRLLLEREVVIVEGLDLSPVPSGVYQLVCLPLRLAGLDGAPARVVLIAQPAVAGPGDGSAS